MKGSRLFISRIPGYLAARFGGLVPPPPMNITYSITGRCNSDCKTCLIGKEGLGKDKDLDLPEIERFLSSVGPVSFFNISGGEPFLRNDLVEICQIAARTTRPDVIHIPTNGILTKRIVERTEAICRAVDPVRVTIKPSFDGVGELHDEIRGVKGNFPKLLETYHALKELKTRVRNLEIGLGTVVSRFNVDRLPEILDMVETLDPDSYITEVAEEREEMSNLGSGITPSALEYGRILPRLREFTLRKQAAAEGVSRLTLAFRAVYYELTHQWLRTGERPLPCWAGITNVHVAPDGEVWPCCVLAGRSRMGHLRENDFRFDRVWGSEEAARVRRQIAAGGCACPLANQAYANIALSPTAAMAAGRNFLEGRLSGLLNQALHRGGPA